MGDLIWEITGIWEVGEPAVESFGKVHDPQSCQVEIPLNDARTATVTMSVHEPVLAALATLPQVPYMACLRVYYRGSTVAFWGPITTRTVDMGAGTVTLTAVDPSIKLTRHFLRRGDLADTLGQAELRGVNGDQGWISVDHRGLRALRDAATTETFAPLGIIVGFNDVEESANLLGVSRGDQVWEKWLELVNTGGPDFDLRPVLGTPGAYVTLDTVQHLGSDLSAYGFALHYGCGRNNLEGVSFTDGEQYTNLVHAIDADSQFRVTKANATTLARTGPYMEWLSTGYTAPDGVPASQVTGALEQYADDVLAVAGEPSRTLTLTLPVDTDPSMDGFWFGNGFYVGDSVPVAARNGNIVLNEELYRIVRVTLSQDGESVRPELEVAAASAGTIDDTDT